VRRREFCCGTMGVLMLTGCGGKGDTSSKDATIEAYQYRVATLETQNERLPTKAPSPTNTIPPPTYDSLRPAATLGDGKAITYGKWTIKFNRMAISPSASEPSESIWTTWVTVENIDTQSVEFPFGDFRLMEPYGAYFPPTKYLSAEPEVDWEKPRIPGTRYDVQIVFYVPREVTEGIIVAKDGTALVKLGAEAMKAVATPVPSLRVDDGKSVEYKGFALKFPHAYLTKEIEARSGFGVYQADDTYLVVVIEATNSTKTKAIFPYDDFILATSAGESYTRTTFGWDQPFDVREEDDILPGKEADIHIVFSITQDLEEMTLQSVDGSVVVAIPSNV